MKKLKQMRGMRGGYRIDGKPDFSIYSSKIKNGPCRTRTCGHRIKNPKKGSKRVKGD